MPLNELPGHHQRFNAGGICLVTVSKHYYRHGHHQNQDQFLHNYRRHTYQYI
jgi:hypothetical protein